LTGCNYPELTKSIKLSILGTHIPENLRRANLIQGPDQMADNANGRKCWSFPIPTVALTHPELVIKYENSKTPESLPVVRYRPYFDDPIVIPNISTGIAFSIDKWTIDIPAGRVDCNDKIDAIDAATKVTAQWKIGPLALDVLKVGDFTSQPCNQRLMEVAVKKAQSAQDNADAADKTAEDKMNAAHAAEQKAAAIEKNKKATKKQKQDAQKAARIADDAAGAAVDAANVAHEEAAAAEAMVDTVDWDAATKNGQIILELTVDRATLHNLPWKKQMQILRGPFLSRIATLPSIPSMLLPSKLTVATIGTTQFALEGDHAEVIDAVAVQGPGGFNSTIRTATAAQIALVTLMDSSSSSSAPKTGITPKPAASGMPEITKVAPDSVPTGTKVVITGKNFGTKPGTVSFTKDIDAPVPKNCWTDTSITVNVPENAAGPISIKIRKASSTQPFPFTVVGAAIKPPQPITCPAPATKQASEPTAPKAGTYTIVPLVALSNDGKEPILYQPIDVRDPKGNPLTFTVPVAPKDATTNPQGTEGPTTTVTISKKTTVTPAPKTASTTPAAGGTN
jgi:IPT/TIG domain